MKEELPLGYVVPLHRSLVQHLYWLGVPRELLMGEFFFALLGGIIFKAFSVVLIAFILHLIFSYLGEKDPLFHKVFFRARQHKLFYR